MTSVIEQSNRSKPVEIFELAFEVAAVGMGLVGVCQGLHFPPNQFLLLVAQQIAKRLVDQRPYSSASHRCGGIDQADRGTD